MMLASKLFKVRPLLGRGGVSRSNSNSVKSALYITSESGISMTNVVVPDVSEALEFKGDVKAKMIDNLKARKMAAKFNLDEITTGVEYLEWMKRETETVQDRRSSFADELRELFVRAKTQRLEGEEKARLQALMKESQETKQSMSEIRTTKTGIEETTLITFLRLPCDLDPRTPTGDKNATIFKHGGRKKFTDTISHVEIGKNDLVIENGACYLMGKLALQEMRLTDQIREFFSDNL